jgi:membrane-associated PAP2 superfamily phosphatase
MSPTPSLPAMRESTPSRQMWLGTVLTLLVLLAWDFSGLDLRVMQSFADRQGFVLRGHWWMEKVLHDWARQVAILVYLGMLLMVWLPWGRFRSLRRIQRVEIWVGITLGLLCINLVKRYSLTSCPWDLAEFGGVARYVSHWQWGLGDGGGGQCFPGGHASAAMAFVALSLPWLGSDLQAKRRQGLRMLIGVIALGLLLGGVQTLRGAHYPSHTLWTGLICWGVALLNHLAFARWACTKEAAAERVGFA